MKYLYTLLAVLIGGLMITTSAYAVTSPRVYFERVGNFGVRLLIDSDEPVNAYDIHAKFNTSIAGVDAIDASRSIVTVLPAPIKTDDGEIIIRGGSTQAFSGTRGELLTIQLKPKSTGVIDFTVTEATAYRANGEGTPLTLQKGVLSLRVTRDSIIAYEHAKANGLLSASDNVPPQITTIEIQGNPLRYGERLVVFQAMDKETGIARYEARERSWLTWSAWREAFNPYPPDPGAWEIQIKAIDYNNNFALATVYQLGNAIWKALVSILLLALLLLGIKALIRGRHSGV